MIYHFIQQFGLRESGNKERKCLQDRIALADEYKKDSIPRITTERTKEKSELNARNDNEKQKKYFQHADERDWMSERE